MYSPFHFYFNIRGDRWHSRTVAAHTLKSFLRQIDELAVTDDASYGAVEGAPSLSLTLLNADRSGNYSSAGGCPERVNLISVVGSKSAVDTERPFYVELVTKIARFLDWEAIEEEDEDGNEEVVLWRPALKVESEVT